MSTVSPTYKFTVKGAINGTIIPTIYSANIAASSSSFTAAVYSTIQGPIKTTDENAVVPTDGSTIESANCYTDFAAILTAFISASISTVPYAIDSAVVSAFNSAFL